MEAEQGRSKEPAWLVVARAELAKLVREFDGPASNPQIDAYHGATAAGSPPRDGDATAWCSSFVNWCLLQVGIVGTKSKAARSWLTWGREIAAPVPGCIVVFWRESPDSGKGHVGLFLGFDETGRILCLGGNQGNQVSVRPYARSRVLSYRLPEKECSA